MATLKTIFPDEMLNPSGNTTMSLESIAGKLAYFHEQIHLLHWQTTNKAEHKALGSLYEDVQDFKDDVIEKLMGYMGKRVKTFKIDPIKEVSTSEVINSLGDWAYSLYEWAGANHYCDIENMAQDLSGKVAKTKYLLTLS